MLALKSIFHRHFVRIITLGLILAWAALRLAALNRPFWIDESFSAALACQNPSTIVQLAAKDVHPPGYYLALHEWNGLMRAISRSPRQPAVWQIVDFRNPVIETEGLFEWRGPRGATTKTPGVFLDQPIYWGEVPLAPLTRLRLLSLIFAGLAVFFTWALARRLFPESKYTAVLLLALFAFSGFTLNWDTVIRSYSCQAAFSSALVWCGIWGWQQNRLKVAGAGMAALVALSFLADYPTLVVFPGAALAIWLVAGLKRRALVFTAISFSAGGILALVLWGRPFFGQFGKIPAQAFLAQPLVLSARDQFLSVAQEYWRLVFSEGFWQWLANGRQGELNIIFSLCPVNPLLYLIGFSLYAVGLVTNVFLLRPGAAPKRESRMVLAVALAGLLPGTLVLVGNVIKPGFFRLHAQHYYPALPFFYLLLAHGLASLPQRLGRRVSQLYINLRFIP